MSNNAENAYLPENAKLAFSKRVGSFLIRLLILSLCFVVTFVMGLAMVLTVVNSDMIADSIIETFEFKGITAAEINAGESVDAEIASAINKELEERYRVTLNTEQMISVMEQLDVSGFLQNYLDRYTEYIKETGHLPEIDINEYVDIIETNKELIEYITGKKLGTRFYKYQSIVVKNVNSYNKKAQQFNDRFDRFAAVGKILSKDYVSAAVGIVFGLVYVLYAFLRYKRGYKLYSTFRVYTVMMILASQVMILFRNHIINVFVKQNTVSGAVLNKIMLEIFDYPVYFYIALAVIFAVLWILFALPYYKRVFKKKSFSAH